MKNKRWLALLLALACILLAGCRSGGAEKSQPDAAAPEKQSGDAAGADWRTWGSVSDRVVLETQDGELALLLCVYTKNAVLYYDDATQTEYAVLEYPHEIADAQEAYVSFSLTDRNTDGNAGAELLFRHADGTQTQLLWLREGERFVYSPDPGEGAAQAS